MPKHDFGIMQEDTSYKERFDIYEPQKYNCIKVDDNFIEPILMDLQGLNCYWHTLQKEGKGLAYCGITLIPPKSIDAFINILSFQNKANKENYISLILLATQAKEHSKYIIHFGI